MADEVHAKTEVKPHDEAGKAADLKPGKGKGGPLQKYKWWIVGGVLFVILLAYYFIHKNSAASASTTAANTTASDIDPSTGYVTGSAADLAALGQSQPTPSGSGSGDGAQGLTGDTGPAGATGPAGVNGKAPDLWQIATAILKGRGIKDPSHSQILGVWKHLKTLGAPGSPAPKKTPVPTKPHPSPNKPAHKPKK